ncbi:MAG: hypothetical protein JWM32_423 [Verrucomicrobia bacterium]|nr:hypothetical protein [Verrucomicrobiota bacterium]
MFMSSTFAYPESRLADGAVEEVQGLYGSYSFSEKLLQKIWLRGDFDRTGMVVSNGERWQVIKPGKWNLLGGPDFKDARLRSNHGREIVGDVELHLHAEGWAAHGHARDPAYNRVVLHVVLFPPAPDHVSIGHDGRAIPVVTLLPLLNHDLEQFAAEEAVEALANRPASRIIEDLAALPETEVQSLLHKHADGRWKQKVHFARLRIRRLGWEAACHHAALETLGYRFNRAPMLRIASAWPLERWSDGRVETDSIFATEEPGWSLQGVRPANHPRIRLAQYATWTRMKPNWPELLKQLSQTLPELAPTQNLPPDPGSLSRPELRRLIAGQITADIFSAGRFDNLVCDAFLPLMTAGSGRDFHGLWFQWYAGDQPPLLQQVLRDLGLAGRDAAPIRHGLLQGLLGWLLERESRE